MSLNDFFTKNNVQLKPVPYGLKSIPLAFFEDSIFSTAATQILAFLNQNNLLDSFKFPGDYISFIKSHGPGTLEKCRIFAPLASFLEFQDIRLPQQADVHFHTKQLHLKIRQNHEDEQVFDENDNLVVGLVASPQHAPIHTFPMHLLIVFALDVNENLYYCWRVDRAAQGDYKVYVVDDHAEAPPPTAIAEDFTEFCKECCLGNALKENGIKKTQDQKEEDNEENDNDDEDCDEDNEEEMKLYSFKPFAAK